MYTGLVGIEDTRITNNSATVNGGGIWAGNHGQGTLWLEDSTIDNNTSDAFNLSQQTNTNMPGIPKVPFLPHPLRSKGDFKHLPPKAIS